MQGIFTGALYYGFETIVDIGTLVGVVGAGVISGSLELLGINKSGTTGTMISNILSESEKAKLNTMNEMMKDVPSGSFGMGRALGFATDVLMAFGTVGASLAGREALVKSVSKIAPDFAETQRKILIKTALKHLKESEIEELMKKGDLEQLLSKLPKEAVFKILNPELTGKITNSMRRQFMDNMMAQNVVASGPGKLQYAMDANKVLASRIEKLYKVDGFAKSLEKLSDAELGEYLKKVARMNEVDYNKFVDDLDDELFINGNNTTNRHFISEYKLKPNTKYSVNGYSYNTDELGRIVSARGELFLNKGIRNKGHQLQAGGIDRVSGKGGDHGGHLIATRFNGSPLIDNIVAMNGNVNTSAYKKLENA